MWISRFAMEKSNKHQLQHGSFIFFFFLGGLERISVECFKEELSGASKEAKNQRQIAHGRVEYWFRSFCRAETNKGIQT